MSPVAWVAVTWIIVNGTVQVTKAGLNYRASKRRDAAKGATS